MDSRLRPLARCGAPFLKHSLGIGSVVGLAMAAAFAPALADTKIENPVAVFSGLDKITGRITKFDARIDETVTFGALQVTPRVCYTRPPTEAPQTTAFVETDEITPEEGTKRIFTGWMFAASPGLNAVEHPIYDVWLIDCKTKDGESASGQG